MTVAAQIPPDVDWATRDLLDGRHASAAGVVRELVQRTAWNTALRIFARPLHIQGQPLQQPAVYVANHASHADTALIRFAAGGARRRLAVAAADDYFFSTPARATAFTLSVGAFPFPRHGDVGLRRAAVLLNGGWSVVLYPQGTRNAGSQYRPGALRLAEQGWPVVPVGVAGTGAILPKGATRPRRCAAAVVFGQPLPIDACRGEDAMGVLAGEIEAAAARAEAIAA